MVFTRGELLLLPVDGPPGRGKNEPLHTRASACLEGVDRPEHVHRGIEERISHRAAHVHLSGQVEKGVRLSLCDQFQQSGCAHVEDGEVSPRRHVLALAMAQVVDRGDAVPAGQQGPERVAPDESRSTRHDDVHGAPLR
jgi:hypothetical protein